MVNYIFIFYIFRAFVVLRTIVSSLSLHFLTHLVAHQQQTSAAAQQSACLCPTQPLYLCCGLPEFAGASSATYTLTHHSQHLLWDFPAVLLSRLHLHQCATHVYIDGQKKLYSVWRNSHTARQSFCILRSLMVVWTIEDSRKWWWRTLSGVRIW